MRWNDENQDIRKAEKSPRNPFTIEAKFEAQMGYGFD